MKEKKLKLISDDPKQSKLIVPGEENKGSKEKKKPGRPTLLTPELYKKLIKLFEKHFFIASVSASSGIYRESINIWRREQVDFSNAVTYAQDKWIKNQLKLLQEYSIDKRTKDWRALKYLLSIADAEFNDKKFMRDTPAGKDTSITININHKELVLAKLEANRLIGSSQKQESISLIPFKTIEKPKKSNNQEEGELESE